MFIRILTHFPVQRRVMAEILQITKTQSLLFISKVICNIIIKKNANNSFTNVHLETFGGAVVEARKEHLREARLKTLG